MNPRTYSKYDLRRFDLGIDQTDYNELIIQSRINSVKSEFFLGVLSEIKGLEKLFNEESLFAFKIDNSNYKTTGPEPGRKGFYVAIDLHTPLFSLKPEERYEFAKDFLKELHHYKMLSTNPKSANNC